MYRREGRSLSSHRATSTPNSSSLFDFSSVPSLPAFPSAPSPYTPATVPAFSMDSEVYRGVDFSSSILTTDTLSSSSSYPAFQDMDSSLSPSSSSSSSSLKGKDLSIPTLIPSLSFPLPSPTAAGPFSVPSSPAFLERYTTFYAAVTDAAALLQALSALFTSSHIDHTVDERKHKICASLLCPLMSALSIGFIVRLYRADSGGLLVEVQRRDGCVVVFNKAWAMLHAHCRANGLVDRLYDDRAERDYQEAGPTAPPIAGSLCRPDMNVRHNPQSSLLPLPPTPSRLPAYGLDATAFGILTNMVDNGDIVQQRDALRLIALSVLSSPSSVSSSPLLNLIPRWSLHPTAPLDDERATQLARLMLIVTQREQTNPRAFIHQCLHPLLSLLREGVDQGEMTLLRLRCVRYLVATLAGLSVTGAAELSEVVSGEDRRVLEKCAEMSDDSIRGDSRKVLERLDLVC